MAGKTQSVEEAYNAWQRAKARSRGAAVQALLDKGFTQAEIARTLGITRQRVTQLVKRHRELESAERKE